MFSSLGFNTRTTDNALARLDTHHAATMVTTKKTAPPGHELVIADAIHGDIVLTDFEASIIGTREFQRLRRVRQLGFASLVFPTALHTRFDHSIGTCWMAKELIAYLTREHPRADHNRERASTEIETLELSYQQRFRLDKKIARAPWKQVVTAAALLHDISHIPFGHSLEDELPHFQRHDSLESPRLHRALYGPNSQLASLFDRPTDWIVGLDNKLLRDLIYLTLRYTEQFLPLEGGRATGALGRYVGFEETLDAALGRARKDGQGETEELLEQTRTLWVTLGPDAKNGALVQPFMADIVSNTLSADLLDYLRRDAWFCGLAQDFHLRILRAFDVARETRHSKLPRVFVKMTDRRGALRSDIRGDLLGILNQRYQLAAKVYYHPVKAAATRMLLRAMEIAIHPDVRSVAPALATLVDEETLLDSAMSDDVLLRDLASGFRTAIEATTAETLPSVRKLLQEGHSLSDDLVSRRLYKRFFSGYAANQDDETSVSEALKRFRGQRLRDGVATQNRSELETRLTADLLKRLDRPAADPKNIPSEFLAYCPGRKMQAKVATVRVQSTRQLTIEPLTARPEALRNGLQDLHEQYHLLWRLYVFVSPDMAPHSDTLNDVAASLERELDLENEINKGSPVPPAARDSAPTNIRTRIVKDVVAVYEAKIGGGLAPIRPERVVGLVREVLNAPESELGKVLELRRVARDQSVEALFRMTRKAQDEHYRYLLERPGDGAAD